MTIPSLASTEEAAAPALSVPTTLPAASRQLLHAGRRTVFVRRAEWKTGTRMAADELSAWLRRRRVRESVLLTMLSEHRYLTTEQIRSVFFPSLRAAQYQLRFLAVELRLVMRWPQLEPVVVTDGPAPTFWGWLRRSSLLLLTERGAAVVAAYRRLDLQSLVRRSFYAAEYCFHVEHDLEANAFWVGLASAARDRPDQGLYHWVGDDAMRRNYQELGVDLAPDGWGRYLTADREVLFALEWDRGTEAPQRLARKAQGYVSHRAGRVGESNHVLVVLPSPTREDSIRDALARVMSAGRSVRFWTTHAALIHELGPLGEIWKEASSEHESRIDLPAMPGRPRTARRVEDCIGKPTWWERRPGGGGGA